jgi:hypothetical protein
MSPYDILYIVAYALFLCGASLACRGVWQKQALWIMGAGMLINFFGTVIPNPGFQSLAIGIGSNAAIVWAIALGVAVWAVFLAAVFVRLMGRRELFFSLIVGIKLCWLADLILFIYGVYALTG